MKEFTITSIEEGQRFDKYLIKLLPEAGKSFIYKMLRKKNITLNNKKADGSEKIIAGDSVKIFFKDDTFDKFSGKADISLNMKNHLISDSSYKLDVQYENEDFLVVNKPSGMLSQKAAPDDISINEFISAYISDNNSASGFKPGICNRLDRNTSGLVVAGKTMYGLQTMSMAFHDRTLLKYYICIVKGCFNTSVKLSGYLKKDINKNISTIISDEEYEREDNRNKSEFSPINTEFIPVISGQNMSLIKVHLITGKPHQIRAHLMFTGFPVAGDHKYGDGQFNKYLSVNYGIKSQMLHAFQLIIPPEAYPKTEKDISISTLIPKEFVDVLKGEDIWRPGIQEDLEALR